MWRILAVIIILAIGILAVMPVGTSYAYDSDNYTSVELADNITVGT